jgi:flagellar basal-body rod protein FlgB
MGCFRECQHCRQPGGRESSKKRALRPLLPRIAAVGAADNFQHPAKPPHPVPKAIPMLDKLTANLGFHGQALALRSERQRTLASNIANADTPGYAARDFNFAAALGDAVGAGSGSTVAMAGGARSHAGHIPLGGGATGGAGGIRRDYTVQTQPSLDGNTVDLDRERAAFADNAVRYEATLRFINGNAKTMLAAITGQ